MTGTRTTTPRPSASRSEATERTGGRNLSRWDPGHRGALVLVLAVLAVPIMLFAATVLNRPERPTNRQVTAQQPERISPGIAYWSVLVDAPRPAIAHVAEIDLTADGTEPSTTPPAADGRPNIAADDRHETIAMRTSEFAEAYGLRLAVNANFFYPFREETLWSYEPASGDPTNLVGLAVSNGDIVSPPERNRPALCFVGQMVAIDRAGTCAVATSQAVAGKTVLLENGEPTAEVLSDDSAKPYPLLIAGTDDTGSRLWLVVVDGKQPLYSEGLTIAEGAEFVRELGATTALRLDGGGSATMVLDRGNGPTVVNAVIHAKIPGQERPVANHLGFK